MMWFFVVSFTFFIGWSLFYIMTLRKVMSEYQSIVHAAMDQADKNRESMVSLALSKNINEYKEAQQPPVGNGEYVTDLPKEISTDVLNVDQFDAMIKKILEPEAEEIDG